MKNEDVATLMETMEARFKEYSEASSKAMEARFTSLLEQISGIVEPQSSKRKRITSSSLSAISLDVHKGLELENLPREIVAEIMSRVPTESLMRFKCMNKSWYFIIKLLVSDSEFVAKHHRRAEANPTVILFKEAPPSRRCYKIRSNSIEEDGIAAVRPQRIFSAFVTDFVETTGEEGEIRFVTKDIDVSQLPSSLVRRRSSGLIEIYHCNGIVFLTYDRLSLTLYNPVMSVFSTFRPKSDVKSSRNSEILAMGFGSDSGATSFKFVRILSSMKAQVYNPGNPDNSWREIEFSVCNKELGYTYKHVYVRGYIFWLFLFPSLCLCFDVAGESFKILALPDEFIGKKYGLSILTACEGSLCLCFRSHREKLTYGWEMNIGDGSFFWSKWIRTEVLPGESNTPVSFWRSDKLLLTSSDYDYLSYDVYTKEYKKLSVNGVLGRIRYLGPYVNSLASMKWMMKKSGDLRQ